MNNVTYTNLHFTFVTLIMNLNFILPALTLFPEY